MIVELKDKVSIIPSKIVYTGNNLEILFILFISLSISFLFFICQIIELDIIKEYLTFKKIKNNMNNMKKLNSNKTLIEIDKGKKLVLSTSLNLTQFNCYNINNYYVAARINKNTYLPEFIRKDTADVWKINGSDDSSQQFCQYLIMEHADNTITCGIQMYEEIGYGGYFNLNHPCQLILNKMKHQNIGTYSNYTDGDFLEYGKHVSIQ